MRILSKRPYHFVRPPQHSDDKKPIMGDQILWVKKDVPTDVPDWVRDDDQFKRALKAGHVLELVVPVEKPVPEKVEAKVEVKEKEPEKKPGTYFTEEKMKPTEKAEDLGLKAKTDSKTTKG